MEDEKITIAKIWASIGVAAGVVGLSGLLIYGIDELHKVNSSYAYNSCLNDAIHSFDNTEVLQCKLN